MPSNSVIMNLAVTKLFLWAVLILAVSSQVVTVNLGCKTFAATSMKCLECSNRFFMDADGICQPVSSSCASFNYTAGQCVACYDGFLLLETACVPNLSPIDTNCANMTKGVCYQCSHNYFLKNGSCLPVDPLCKTFDYVQLVCSECYGGYSLADHVCVVQPPALSNPGCAAFNGSVCVRCAKDYYMGSGGLCVQASTTCNTFDPANGNCLTCFSGWILTNNSTCVADPNSVRDPYCARFANGSCVSCSSGYYFNASKACVQVDPFCKTFNSSALVCAKCYSGFALVGGVCSLGAGSQPVLDVNCKLFDGSGVCLNCSKGFYFDSNKVCTQISGSCAVFDYVKTVCTACYPGYAITVDGSCVSTAVADGQSNCAQMLNGVCVKCVDRAYADFNNNCVKVSDLCSTFNTFNGFCTSCYSGYALNTSAGVCYASETAACTTYNPGSGLCTKCINGFYLDGTSQCQLIDSQCQTFNYTLLKCGVCYKGYVLNSLNACVLAPTTNANIQNCVSYDLTGQNCVKCYSFYYVANNLCAEVSPFCKTYDPTNGNCLTCYTSFVLNAAGQCQHS